MPPPTPHQAIMQTVREEWGRILAALVKTIGHFQLAEDCLQDAVTKALEVWPKTGLPRVPAAWLITTARRRAIDRVRRDARFAARADELSHLLDLENAAPDHEQADMIPDKRLEMIFTCCHPALDEKTRMALTLRTLGGLTTEAIAAAFLATPSAMAQRLVRAKHKITAAGIPYDIPDRSDLPDRIATVLGVIYLIFNAGYSNAGSGQTELSDEAIRLARIIHHLMPNEAEVAGLLALMLLHDARRLARHDKDVMIALKDQNRARWDRAKIAQGEQLLTQTLPRGQIGPYQVQAAISAVHAGSPTWDATDWPQIAALYALLYRIQPSPVVRLNHALALSYAQDAATGMAMLDTISDDPQMTHYQPYHAARADLLERLGHLREAATWYQSAIALTDQPAERAFLVAKCTGLGH